MRVEGGRLVELKYSLQLHNGRKRKKLNHEIVQGDIRQLTTYECTLAKSEVERCTYNTAIRTVLLDQSGIFYLKMKSQSERWFFFAGFFFSLLIYRDIADGGNISC